MIELAGTDREAIGYLNDAAAAEQHHEQAALPLAVPGNNLSKICWSMGRPRDILKVQAFAPPHAASEALTELGRMSESFVGPRSWVRWAGMDPGGTDNLGFTRLVAVQRKYRDTE